MYKPTRISQWQFIGCLLAGLLGWAGGTGLALASDDSSINIKEARWSSWRDQLYVEGERAPRYATVTVSYTGDGTLIGTTQADREGRWNITVYNLDPVPCRVRAEAGGSSDERSVERAPRDCSNHGGGAANTPPTANDDAYNTAQDTQLNVPAPGVLANDTDPDEGDTVTAVPGAGSSSEGGSYDLNADGSFTYTPAAGFTGDDTFTYVATDGTDTSAPATVTITVTPEGGGGDFTARGDAYATPVGTRLDVEASRVSGVLYNDFGGTGDFTAQLVSGPSNGSLNLSPDGSFSYTPNNSLADNDNDSFTYRAVDSTGAESNVAKVNINILSKQTDFKIMMNYELGMHCTGFEFAYCCVLPPYNSILAQILKPENGGGYGEYSSGRSFPRLLEGDPREGLDGLGRETVVRDYDRNGNFRKYYLEYYHDAQPRREGQGKPQTSTLISDVEGNSLLYTNTRVDSAAIGANGELVYGLYAGAAYGVWQGDGDFEDATDNYANAWLNHFYIYADLEGTVPGECAAPPANAGNSCTADAACDTSEGSGDGACDTDIATTRESNKIRLGVQEMIEYPKNVGAALQPMGPEGNVSGFDNVLTFSADTGTVVYTQMKVLENLPVMLTSPRIWEALGLPLTPFEDSIDFFGDPGAVNEDTIRPYVAMKAKMYEYPSGNAVIGSNGHPVIGFGTAPIDIPNCERCHSAPSINSDTGEPNINSPNYVKAGAFDTTVTPTGLGLEALTNLEYEFWVAFYGLLPGDSDWYARLKAAAINMMALHDSENGTEFTAAYPGCGDPTGVDPTNTNGCGAPPGPLAQNTRLGFESVICQKCHADNVIAVVKSGCELPVVSDIAPLCQDASGGNIEMRKIIQPITEAIHWNHRGTDEGGVISFSDGLGRDGGCQGCHPAHRSDGVMDGYPITLDGDNVQAGGDNRLAPGGCFVGRDVHSNPLKDVDGAETDEYLNAVGQWLKDNVARGQAGLAGSDADNRGIWCTNCHNQLGQELWRVENCPDLINGECITNPRGEPTLAAVAAAVGVSEAQAIAWLDPTDPDKDPHGTNLGDFTHAIWNPDVVANPDASVALIEASLGDCGTRFAFPLPRFGANACLDFDGDPGGIIPPGDPSVRILDFCTTPDCEAAANAMLANEGTCADGDNAGQACAVDGTVDEDNADCSAGGGSCSANGSFAFAAPFDAATDGRDHWLSPGEPHCADCHQAPFVEQSGNINPFPPFNYPRKASLMRYSRGHQDISCQGCHESIHGLYPVSPTIDSTSYAQAAALNHDGSHGPLKCGTCHEVDGSGTPTWLDEMRYNGERLRGDFESSVAWAHTFTDEASVRDSVCRNCHGDEWSHVTDREEEWLEHADKGRVSRLMMDKAEIEKTGAVFGSTDPRNTVCQGCHGDEWREVSCGDSDWRQHLTRGRVSESVWEAVSVARTGTTCGW